MSFFKVISAYCNRLSEEIDSTIDDIMKEEANLSEKQAKQTIIKYDRIDTGLMLETVRAETLFSKSKKKLSLISDQEQNGVYYSSFQEFGTNAIKGIFFVNNSMNNAVKNLEQKLNEELKQLNDKLLRG